MDLNQFLTTLVLLSTLFVIGVFSYVGILLIWNLKSIKRILTQVEKTEELIKSVKDLATIGFAKLANSFSNNKKKLKN
ncbi:MAG: hypothetical protein NZM26_01650 [Patescibacteria group bacterium]|nr:hypothetical protein [Patescibacteria group bacterium]